MNGTIRKWIWPLTAMTLMVLMLSSAPVSAWYPTYTNVPYYQPYSYPYAGGRPYPYYAGPGGLQGYYSGYAKPRIYMRGRINRYGDYRVDIKLRGVSQNDLYKIWWLFQQYGHR